MPFFPCRNVFFDLDGTLLDSRPGIVASLRHAVRALGHELPAEEPLDWAIGPPLPDVMARLLASFGDSRVEAGVTAYRAFYREEGLFDADPYPGIADVLARLTKAGKRLWVTTAKRTDFARPMLEHFSLARHFRGIHGVEVDGRFTHKADLVGHLLSTERLEPAATVLVGDREHDVAAARANGLRVIAVTYGYGSREELERAGPDQFCAHVEELVDLLGRHFTPAPFRNTL